MNRMPRSLAIPSVTDFISFLIHEIVDCIFKLINIEVMATMVAKWSEGHTDSIICLAHNGKNLASGGEDHYICLWTNEGKILSKLHLQDDVTSICFQPSNPSILYAASGNKLNLIDVRDFNNVKTIEFNSEEINKVVMNLKEMFIATCDDSGDVKVVDLREMRLFKTLQRHKNICSSVKFHPTKGCELVSAGMDCIVNSWDFMKGRNLSSFNMHECPSGETDDSIPSGMYMVNPPLIHSIDISCNGSKVMCGLENGKVQVLELAGRGRFEPLCGLKGHTRGVSNLEVLQRGEKELMLSGGNDGMVIAWEMNKQKPTQHSNHKKKGKGKGRLKKSEEKYLKSDEGVVDPPTGASSTTHTIVTKIEHGDKVNCLISAIVDGSKTLVYVADPTETISLYDISKSISPQSD